MKKTILNQLRGESCYKIGNDGLLYKNGSLLLAALLILLAVFTPALKNTFGIYIASGVVLSVVMFGATLAVRVGLPAKDEIS